MQIQPLMEFSFGVIRIFMPEKIIPAGDDKIYSFAGSQ